MSFGGFFFYFERGQWKSLDEIFLSRLSVSILITTKERVHHLQNEMRDDKTKAD